MKRANTHNADWGSSTRVVPNGRDLKEPSWPLGITLKEGTRQALFREFGLKDRLVCTNKQCSQASLSLMRKNASRMLSLSSSKTLLQQKVEARMLPGHKERSREALQQGSKNFSSPNCGLRRSCHLGATRRATVASLQPMQRASIFRQAIKQQQS